MNEEQIEQLSRWNRGLSRHLDLTPTTLERQLELPDALSPFSTVAKGNPSSNQVQIRRVIIHRCEDPRGKPGALEGRQAEVSIDGKFDLLLDGRFHGRSRLIGAYPHINLNAFLITE